MKHIAALLLLICTCAALSATDPLVLVDQNAKPYQLCGNSPELTQVPSQPQHQRVLVDGNGYSYVPNCGGAATPESQGYVGDVQAAAVSITTTGTTTLNVPSNLFSKADVGKTIIITGAGTDLLAGANTGTIAGGAGYSTNGTYTYVPLTCSNCADSRAAQAFATITVSGGAVSSINTNSGSGQEGYFYTVGDVLTTPDYLIGGRSGGSAYTYTLTTTAQAPLVTTIVAFVSPTQVTLGAAMNSHVSNNTCGGATCVEYIWWGGLSGAGGVNDAGAQINKAFASSSVVRLSKGYYGSFTTIVPPATHAAHLRCDPGAIILALGPMSGANAADNNAPYNAMFFAANPPSASSNGIYGQNDGSTIQGCNFEGAFVVQNGPVTASHNWIFLGDIIADMWGGTTIGVAPGSDLTIRNHGQDALVAFVKGNNGSTRIPDWNGNAQQQIQPAHCFKVADTDTILGHSSCTAYGDSAVLLSGADTITASTTSGSPNLTVTNTTGGIHIGDHLTDNAAVGGQGLIPVGAVIVSGPVGGFATQSFTTTITSGSSTIATSNPNHLPTTQGQLQVVFTCATNSNSCSMGTITGISLGHLYYLTNVTASSFQICVQPSCGSVITPAGGGTANPVGQGMYTGVVSGGTQTFVMSVNATGTSSGSDTIKVGDMVNGVFQSDGSSGTHIYHMHAFQSSGATPFGPCWQVDSGNAMLSPNNQCDGQTGIQDGMNIRTGSNFVEGFYSNLTTSFYVGTRGVRIDPSINTNPQNNFIAGVMQQGYGGSTNTPNLYQDNSSGKNNLMLTNNGLLTVAGTNAPTISDDNGILTQFNDCGGACNNYPQMLPATVGNAAGIVAGTAGAVTSADLGFNVSGKAGAVGSNMPGGILSLSGGNGDSTAGDNQAGGNANLTGGNGFGTGVGGSINLNGGVGGGAGGNINIVSGNGTSAASGNVTIKASATGSSQGTVTIAQAATAAVNILTGASTGVLHLNDGTGTGNVAIGNSADTTNMNSGTINEGAGSATIVNLSTGASTGNVHITDGTGSGTVQIGNSANTTLLTSATISAGAGTASTVNLSTGASTGNVHILDGTGTGTITIGNSGNTGKTTLAGISTGTNADFLCLSAGGVVLLQTSACTISSQRFKTNIRAYDESALAKIGQLPVVSFNLKEANRDPNATATQTGLLAEDVARIAPECAIYENDMKTPKSYRQECLIALLVKSVQELQRQLAHKGT